MDQSLSIGGSSENIIRLHDVVECIHLQGIQGWYTRDYAKGSEHRRKASWYGIGNDPSITLSNRLPIQDPQCSDLCTQYVRTIHLHYPFINLAILAKMKKTFLDKQGLLVYTSSDVIVLLVIALGSVASRQEPLPTPQVEPFERWTELEIACAVQQNIEAIPGLKYYALALSILRTMTNIDLLHEVQMHLLIALYADQIMLLSVRHDHISRACQSCMLLMKR